MSIPLLIKKNEKLVNDTLHWNASLPFLVSSPFPISKENPSLFGIEYKEEDLFDLVAADGPFGACRSLLKWYFCPKKYPPDVDFQSSKDGWPKLKVALAGTTSQLGYTLVENGTNGKSKRSKGLFCARFRRCETHNTYAPSDYRTDYVRSNRRAGSRGVEGLKMARRKDSYRALSKSECCRVRLSIGVDMAGFYLKGSNGCRNHCFHPPLCVDGSVPFASYHELSQEKKELAITLRMAGLSYNATAAAFERQYGMMLKPGQVQNLTKSITYRIQPCGQGHKQELKTTSADRLLLGLCEDKHDHIVLTHQTVGDAMAVHKNIGSTLEAELAFTTFWPEPERSSMRAFISAQRSCRKIPIDQDLFVAVLWVTKGEKEMFRKFPNVVKIDTTFGTNDRSMPLLSVTGLNSNGNTFTIARAYIPNEQSWVFRWILSHALPQLLGVEAMKRIVVILSDGDSTEIAQINHLLDELCPQAHRLRCGWHLVDRGWERLIYHIPKDPFRSKFRLFETTRRILFSWTYSWMTPSCETKEEFSLSRQLFLSFLESKELMSMVGPFFVDKIRIWQATIACCEPNWVFYRRKRLFAREEFTNSSHEASFRQVKYGFASLMPSMDVHESGKNLSIQADVSYKRMKSMAVQDKTRYCLWSSIPELTSKLTKRGAGLLEAEWNRRYDYHSMFDASSSEFRLIVVDLKDDEEGRPQPKASFWTSFAPKFRRIRSIRMETDAEGERRLTCSCCYPERTGLPCRHQLHILVTYFEGYLPKLEDVHCFWWSTYFSHSFVRNVNGARTPLAKNLEEIAAVYNNIPYAGPVTHNVGPRLDLPVDDSIRFQKGDIVDRVMNWTREELQKVLPIETTTTTVEQFGACRVETTKPIPGLSQQTVTYTQDEEFSSDSNDEDNNSTSWTNRWDEDTERLSRSTPKLSEPENPYHVLSPIFKQLVAAVEKDNCNLKECATKLLDLVACIEGKVGELSVEEEGRLALPTSKRKRFHKR
jgi:hypothetical protein